MISSMAYFFVAFFSFNIVKSSTNSSSLFMLRRYLELPMILKNLSYTTISNRGSVCLIQSLRYTATSSSTELSSYLVNLSAISSMALSFRTMSNSSSKSSVSTRSSISATAVVVMLFFENTIAWSSIVKLSLKLPCPHLAIVSTASLSYLISSRFNICDRCLVVSATDILRNL